MKNRGKDMESALDPVQMIRSYPKDAEKVVSEGEQALTTIEVWQPLSPIPLTEADEKEIERNFISFVDLLLKFDSQQKAS